MNNPWDVRPKQAQGDDTPEVLYLKVGEALTVWETLESTMAELFDVIVAAQPSNRAAFAAFTAVVSSSARTQLLKAAAEKAIPPSDPANGDVSTIISAFGEYGARRNEIAHGRVYGLGERGFYLGPNNVMPHKWKDGVAKYQYIAADVRYYQERFAALENWAAGVVAAVRARNLAKTNDTTSRPRRTDKRS